jgi:NodT family efflux transporter outer membrane factor (OMF) lipoprotein
MTIGFFRLAKLTRHLATSLSTLLFVSACTSLGPDYQKPEVPWLQDWHTDLYGQVKDPSAAFEQDLEFWWHLFDDDTLNELIEIAKAENPTIQIAGLRILESRAQLGIAGSTLYPQVQQLNGSANYINSEDHGGVSLDRHKSFANYSIGPSVAWELDFWGRFKRTIESADAAFYSSIYNYQDIQVLLTAQVATLYYAYRTALQSIEINKMNAEIQKRNVEITELKFKRGQDSELDLQQARTQYYSTLSVIPDLEINLVQIGNALSAILARKPGDLAELEDIDGKLPQIDPLAINEMPAKLLMRRPDIRASAAQVAVQSAQIGIAEADYYPSISLLGTINYSGSTLDATPDISLFSGGSGFSWNIFDWGRIENNIRLQDARLQQLIESFQDNVLQAAREIDDAAISVVKTYEQKAIIHESLTSAQRSLEIANKRYAEGYSGFQRVLDAQRALLTQSNNELANHSNHISAIINLYRSMGGGWMETPIDEIIPESTRETMEARSEWGELLTAPLPTETDYSPTQQGTSP